LPRPTIVILPLPLVASVGFGADEALPTTPPGITEKV
jgi:hypothetical protein